MRSSVLIAIAVIVGSARDALGQNTAEVRVRGIHEAPPCRLPDRAPGAPPIPVSLAVQGTFIATANVVDLFPIGFEEVEAADREWSQRFARVHPGPERVGVVRDMKGHAPATAEAALRTTLTDGRELWTIGLRSISACGLRLKFADFNVHDGTMLIYSQRPEGPYVLGPFTRTGPNGTGEFWTATLPADTAYIEVVCNRPPQFRVAAVVHFDRPVGGGRPMGRECEQPAPLTCHIDAVCAAGIDPFARDATGRMSWVVGMGCGYCTGTLLNDLDNETTVPYFLTANHCLSTQAEVDSLEVAFYYQSESCESAPPSWPPPAHNIVSGGTLLATADAAGGNDMTFLRLNAVPPRASLAGWTTLTGAGSYGIHHPRGSWKRAYFVTDVGFCPGCELCPDSDSDEFDFYDILAGIEEGGSSGSGIFTGDGRLCGQLKGHCCLYLSCAGNPPVMHCGNFDEFVVVYGEFEQTYPLIRRWLEVGGTINVNAAYSGPEEGTPSRPFNTLVEGYNYAWSGTRIRIAANRYPETGTFSKRVTLLANGGPVTIGQ